MNLNLKRLEKELKNAITPAMVYRFYKESSNKNTVECPICNKDALSLYKSACMCHSCLLVNEDAILNIKEGKEITEHRTSTGKHKLGDIFTLYQAIHKKWGREYAIYSIAKDFKLISINQYNSLISGCESIEKIDINIDLKSIEVLKKKLDKPAIPNSKLQSSEVISNVYKIIQEISPLEELEALSIKIERKLTSERLQSQYFHMPKVDDTFYNKLAVALKVKHNYNADVLLGVPGFYLDEKTNRIKFVQHKGIGILMGSANGVIRGLQVRAYDWIDKKSGKMHFKPYKKNGKKRSKYFWCSSSNYNMGCGPGSPVDVLIPECNKMKNVCFITEGKFKIEIIADNFSSPAISVQGVSNWTNKIASEVKYIDENFVKINHIYTAYDADLAFNFKIYNECKAMVQQELKPLNLDIRIVVWDYNLGKGLDDTILNGYVDKIKSINFDKFAKLFEAYKRKIKKMYPKTTDVKIFDNEGVEVDEKIIFPIYKEMVLEPLGIFCC